MHNSIFIALLNNGALLLALAVVLDMATDRKRKGRNLFNSIVSGFIIGGLGIGLILASYKFSPGIVFDTRSVLMVVSGLFFGAVPTVVAMVLVSVFRLAQGGPAAWVGVSVVLTTGGLGMLWRFLRRKKANEPSVQELYLLGIVAHLDMLAMMFIMPKETALQVVSGIGLPVLLVYPLLTVAVGALLANRLRRRRTATALAESEATYRNLFQNDHAVMLLVDPATGSITDANPAACRFYGWTHAELVAMTIGQINTLPPEELADAVKKAESVQLNHFQFQHRLADGSVRDVEVASGPVNIDGKRRLYSIVYDITEREREAHLRQQMLDEAERSRLALLGAVEDLTSAKRELQFTQFALDHSADAVLWVNSSGRFSYANDSACRQLGYAREQLLQLRVSDIDPDLPEDRWAAHWEEIKAVGAMHFETRHQAREGRIFPVEVFTSFISDGGYELVCAFVHDISERKQSEVALRSSEERLRITLGSIGDAVIATDTERRITSLNPIAEALTGWSTSDALGQPVEEVFRIVNEHTRKPVESPVALVLASGSIVGLANHTMLIARDGREIPIADSGAPIKDGSGRIFGVVLVFRDQTKERNARKAVEESEARYRNLFENLTAGFALHEMIYDADGNPVDYRFLAVNPAFERLTGLKANEVVGRTVREVLPGTEAYWIETYGRVAQTGEPAGMENHAAELGKYFEVRAFRPAPGQFAVVFSDVTAQRKAEMEMRRLSRAIEQLSETVVVTDADGLIEYVNPAFEKITGYTLLETMGKNPRILKSGMHNADFYEDLWKTISSGMTWEGRFINKRKDGTIYTEDASVSPVRDEQGTIVNYVAVKRDITQELAREERYRQAQKMETVGRLAGGIAHDFNNILQTITGFCEILVLDMDGCMADKKTAHCASHKADVLEIDKAARHAAELTRQLLAFSRKQPTEHHEIDLNAVLKENRRMLQQVLDERIKLELDLPAEPVEVFADTSQMMQIVMNLLVNARDAIRESGVVRIAAENIRIDEKSVHEIAHSRPGEFAVLTVSDTGTGMTDEVLERLFEPFYTNKKVGAGTGLGLAVVYGIIQNHRGWINVSSTLGEGTTFRIYLPAGDEPDVAPPVAASTGREAGPRILLVEDDPVVRNLTGEILIGIGYAVESVETAQAAEELFELQQGKFDLLFIDVMLPDRNGIDLADVLRKQNAGLPVLMFSGHSDEQVDLARIVNNGFCYLRKPFSLKKLLDAVQQSLGSTPGA